MAITLIVVGAVVAVGSFIFGAINMGVFDDTEGFANRHIGAMIGMVIGGLLAVIGLIIGAHQFGLSILDFLG